MKKKSKVKVIILNLILVICIGVCAYSAYNLFDIYKDNYDEKVEINEIKEIVGVPKPDESQELQKFSVDFNVLQARNPDAVAWIVVENTSISYPIVKGSDNEYYLNHTFDGQENYAGSIFMDYRQPSDFSAKNTFIYGHNVYHGTMFAELANYTKSAYFNEHPYIYLYTPQGNYKLEVFSAYIADATSPSYQLEFATDDEYLTYLSHIRSLSANQNDVSVDVTDKIVTLYTCSYENGENPENTEAEYISDRYFIHAKIIENLD